MGFYPTTRANTCRVGFYPTTPAPPLRAWWGGTPPYRWRWGGTPPYGLTLWACGAQMRRMSPTLRKIVYAISFETLGIAVTALALLAMSDASPSQSLIFSGLTATVAVIWSYSFNAVFEAWETRQTTKGRSARRRITHSLLFEAGLVLILVPIMAWWLNLTWLQAIRYEAGLIALFVAYTYAFTWTFDRIFGLPQSAR